MTEDEDDQELDETRTPLPARTPKRNPSLESLLGPNLRHLHAVDNAMRSLRVTDHLGLDRFANLTQSQSLALTQFSSAAQAVARASEMSSSAKVLQQLRAASQLESVVSSLGDTSAIWHARLGVTPEMLGITDAVSRIAREWNPVLEALRAAAPVVELAGLFDAFEPDNWDDAEVRLADATACAEDGIPVVWLPAGELLEELLAQTTVEDRYAVLEAHADEVLQQCEDVLDAIEWPMATDAADLARESIRLFPISLTAAQLLASSVSTGLVDGPFEHARRAYPLRGTTLVRDIRPAMVSATIARAFESTPRDRPATTYNRHDTCHGFRGPRSRAHALVSIMLAVSILREVEELDAEERLVA